MHCNLASTYTLKLDVEHLLYCNVASTYTLCYKHSIWIAILYLHSAFILTFVIYIFCLIAMLHLHCDIELLLDCIIVSNLPCIIVKMHRISRFTYFDVSIFGQE